MKWQWSCLWAVVSLFRDLRHLCIFLSVCLFQQRFERSMFHTDPDCATFLEAICQGSIAAQDSHVIRRCAHVAVEVSTALAWGIRRYSQVLKGSGIGVF